MILKLTPNTHPILHERVKPCSDNLDRREISRILKENMIHYEGIGLSANQIGIGERVFVMMLNIETEETITCFNPEIVTKSDTEILMEEGCLTYPGLWLKVKRPDGIEVQYEDKSGEIQHQAMFGLECRIFLHEYDHMEGTNFTQKVSKIKLNRALKRRSKMVKKSKLVENQ